MDKLNVSISSHCNQVRDISPNKIARMSGLFYLIYILTTVLASVVRSKLIVYGDATATANNIMGSELLFRTGFVTQLVSNEILAMGRRALVTPMDITKVDEVEKAVKETLRELGKIDILVNNSGIAGPTAPIYEVTPEQWDEIFAVNLRGAFLCCRAVVPSIIENRSGKIAEVSLTIPA
jgi:NAD(P)-dependent dehydrogenase (short-subunit alcohol dehydrogenase family)